MGMARMSRRVAPMAPPPRARKSLQRAFAVYARYYLRRHFHAFRVSCRSEPVGASDHAPLLIYSNHPSWWDPLIGLALWREFFPEKTPFAPIDRDALTRYPFFSHLGFFAVDLAGFAGGKAFLRNALAILGTADHLLWVTPQGRFVDVRDRPVRFRPGLGHLACRLGRARILPVAVEYPFWDDRLPEILVRFGQPISLSDETARFQSPGHWTRELERLLERTQDELAGDARARDPEGFCTLWERSTGVGGVYGCWRRLRGLVAGPSSGLSDRARR